MLEIRPNCELCDRDLPPDSLEARICSYECTFCADCVSSVLHNVCPNCGGGFEARPLRPARAYRAGISLVDQPASGERKHIQHGRESITALVARLRDTEPQQR